MNIYEKIQNIKKDLLLSDMKKSGHNKHLNYYYYELEDMIPYIISFCEKYKVFTKFSFKENEATLIIKDIEENKEFGSMIEYTTPFIRDNLKSRSDIQNLGSSQTYARRYLYMIAFDITDSEIYDMIQGKNKEEKKSRSIETKNNNFKTEENYYKLQDFMIKCDKNIEKEDYNKFQEITDKLNTNTLTAEELATVIKKFREKYE